MINTARDGLQDQLRENYELREEERVQAANQERKIKTLLLSPIHLDHHRSAAAPLSLSCHTAIAALLLCCRAVV